ncbi:MAG TPA: DinB family protein [Acidimicrobiales bacterium]
MNRIEIEIELHRGRADTLEWVASLSDDDLRAPRTRSENDPDSWWSHADHFVHTTLIERSFNEMIRRHVRGEQGMDRGLVDESGQALKPMGELMAYVHAYTESWKKEQEGKPLDELVRIGLSVRADTLALLAELDDEQLASRIPGAPWADGTVGGVMAVHAAHARTHRQWSERGTPAE